MQPNSSDASEGPEASEQSLNIRAALDNEGNPILPSLLKRTLRSYAYVDLRLDLHQEALRAAAISGEELQAIADTQKLGMDVVVYAAGGEGLALTSPELEQHLRGLL